MANAHKPICLKTYLIHLCAFTQLCSEQVRVANQKHTKTHNKVRVHTKKNNLKKSKHKERNGLTTCMVVKKKRQQNVGN
jgi:hypothetical protein